MAIFLTIPLTDAEQAVVNDWLDVLMPGLSPAQKKRALERFAKQQLRDELTRRMANVNRQTILDRQAELTQALNTAAAVIDLDPA